MPLNLAEVPTQDLVTELAHRNQAMVWAATDGDEFSCVFDGSSLLCYGLLERAKQELKLADLRRDPQ